MLNVKETSEINVSFILHFSFGKYNFIQYSIQTQHSDIKKPATLISTLCNICSIMGFPRMGLINKDTVLAFSVGLLGKKYIKVCM